VITKVDFINFVKYKLNKVFFPYFDKQFNTKFSKFVAPNLQKFLPEKPVHIQMLGSIDESTLLSIVATSLA